jgi:hypothetical protein
MRPAVLQKQLCCGSAFGHHSGNCYMAPEMTLWQMAEPADLSDAAERRGQVVVKHGRANEASSSRS